MTSGGREQFRGEICGFGTTTGHRIVVGRWPQSPFGSFADVMHESPDGLRTLYAPTDAIAQFVQETYTFDVAKVTAVTAERSSAGLHVAAGPLAADVVIGARTVTGWLLGLVPGRIAVAPWWCAAIDPVARVVLRGVRTKGTAGNGRREWYGATDEVRVRAVKVTADGLDLGGLADVWPPVRFGFSSTPRKPSVVAVTTTVEEL